MNDAMIETDQLNKSYDGKRGIVDVSLRVESGDVFGFLGPNGAGKTTTIRILMALLRADSGSARIAGLDCWADSVAVKRLIGYMPGEPALDGGLTGGQLLEYFGHLRGGVDQTYLKRLVERFELDPTRKFRQYSSGNKRKVVLIQAFMHRPRVLILDEPTSGLDPLNQQEFRRLVLEARDGGATVFVSSHVLSEVEELCSRVGIIRDGRVVRVGGIHEVKDIKRSELTILFSAPVPLEAFATLLDVESAESTTGGRGIHLTMRGTPDAAIKVAARYDVVSVTSHEPSLEDIFLRYYGGDADAPADRASEQVA
jgi:ABC-2 type transport system ATP-binding protein